MDGNAARIDQTRVEQNAPHFGVQVGHFDGVAGRVGPVNVPRRPVDGQSFGRPDVCKPNDVKSQRNEMK